VFLKELSDQDMQKFGIDLIHQDIRRAARDSVFSMLQDMAEQRFEQNILLPLLCEIEKDIEGGEDKYDFYFKKCAPTMEFRDISREGGKGVGLVFYSPSDHLLDFLYERTRRYISIDSEEKKNRIEAAEKQLLEYLTNCKEYVVESRFCGLDYYQDNKAYALIKGTWIGEKILALSNTSANLQKKKQDRVSNLSELLLE